MVDHLSEIIVYVYVHVPGRAGACREIFHYSDDVTKEARIVGAISMCSNSDDLVTREINWSLFRRMDRPVKNTPQEPSRLLKTNMP